MLYGAKFRFLVCQYPQPIPTGFIVAWFYFCNSTQPPCVSKEILSRLYYPLLFSNVNNSRVMSFSLTVCRAFGTSSARDASIFAYVLRGLSESEDETFAK